MTITERQIKQREEARKRSSGLCPVCGKFLGEGQPQYAHKIANKEMWRKKYGSWVIDNPTNGEYVCSLACNASVDIGSSYGNHLRVIADILISEYIRMWGLEGLGKLSERLMQEYRKNGIEV